MEMFQMLIRIGNYSIYVGNIDWTGPSPKIWSNSQCQNLGNFAYNLDNCKRTCLETSGCNAMNANPDGCSLRGCPWPVPEPSEDYENYEGYYATTGIT